MIEIELSYPVKELSPNSRCGYMAKAKAVKQARRDAHYLTIAARGNGLHEGPLPIRYKIIAYPPSRHKHDDDNLISSLKGVRDQIAKVFGVDDCNFKCEGVEWMPSEKPGRIIIHIQE